MTLKEILTEPDTLTGTLSDLLSVTENWSLSPKSIHKSQWQGFEKRKGINLPANDRVAGLCLKNHCPPAAQVRTASNRASWERGCGVHRHTRQPLEEIKADFLVPVQLLFVSQWFLLSALGQDGLGSANTTFCNASDPET